jgi:hypothetical protein
VWLATHRDFADVASLDPGITDPDRDLFDHDLA